MQAVNLKSAIQPLRFLARYKRTVLLAIFLVFVGSGVGFYLYALKQWHLAEAAVKQGKPQDAKSRLDFCLKVWPRSTEVHFLAARAARLAGDFGEAEAHLNQCNKLQNGASQATQVEFLLLRAQGGEQDQVAPALFELVEHQHPDSLMILQTVARAYIHQYRYRPAFDCVNRWLAEAPDSTLALDWRGWIYERMQQEANALNDYRRCVEIDPNQDDVRLRLVELLLERNRPDEAKTHLDVLQQRLPDKPEVAVLWARWHMSQGQQDHDQAQRLLDQVLAGHPSHLQALIHRGKLDLERDRPAEAETWLRKALKIEPANGMVVNALYESLHHQRGRDPEAAEYLAQYEQVKKDWTRINNLLMGDMGDKTAHNPELAAELGELLLRVGEDKTALHWLGTALKINPRHQSARAALVRYYEKKNQADKAAEHRRWLKSQ